MLQPVSQVPPSLPHGFLPAFQGPSEARLSPRDVVAFWRRYAPMIGLCVAAALSLGVTYVLTAPSSFSASTQVAIESRRGSWAGAGGDVSFAQYSLDSSQMESQIQIIKSEQISRRVVRGLDLENDPEFAQPDTSLLATVRGWILEQREPARLTSRTTAGVRALAERLQARRIGQSYVVEISYWSRDPEKAARICNAITAAYLGDLLQTKINAAQGGSEIIERRIAALREQRDAAEAVVRTGVFETESFPSADARVITTASPPDARSWPKGSLVLAFSGVLGLFVGLLAAAIHRGLDTSIRTPDQVEHELGLEALGALPRLWFRGRRGVADAGERPRSRFGVAIRQVRTSLQLRQAKSSLVCVGITSTAGGEGRTTVAANLARALAASGARVLLVDADLSDAGLSRIVARGATAGLVGLLDGCRTLEQVLVRGRPGQPDVLPALRRERRTASIDLLGSPRMGELLASCRQWYEVVLVALPALETSPDARALSPHLDGMILVAEYGRLRADRIAAAVRGLRHANVDVLGVVINRAAGPLHG